MGFELMREKMAPSMAGAAKDSSSAVRNLFGFENQRVA